MKTFIRLIVVLIIVFCLMWLLGDRWSARHLETARKVWPLTGESLTDVPQQFPHTSVNQSARALEDLCRQLGVDIVEGTDTDAKSGYPMSSFTWLIFYKEQDYEGRSEKRVREQITLLWWMIHEGQEFAEPLHYAPLPKEAAKRAETILRSVTYRGSAILD